MANSFNKKELEKRREQKRKEKQQRKEERKTAGSKSFDDMIAYVDENGVIIDTPPDPDKKQEVDMDNIAVSIPKKEDMEEIVLNGRVEYFNSDKGYGFIKNLSGTEKYFFHISNAPTSIVEGNMVTFELERGERGMNAVKIVLAK
ncbi:MAG: cold shock domain-containing protein [Prevotellaceae bacterium]|jgi:cold shock CspA family protein|nr:cold shock domain-containing protein [Prevotellaceae bacterium]